MDDQLHRVINSVSQVEIVLFLLSFNRWTIIYIDFSWNWNNFFEEWFYIKIYNIFDWLTTFSKVVNADKLNAYEKLILRFISQLCFRRCNRNDQTRNFY